MLGCCKCPNLLRGCSQAAVPAGWKPGTLPGWAHQPTALLLSLQLAELRETLGCSILASPGTEAECRCLRSAKEESLGVSVVWF